MKDDAIAQLSDQLMALTSRMQEFWLDYITWHVSVCPRRISTALYNGAQVMAHNKQQALSWFKAANYVDCRINAYSALYVERNDNGKNRQAPDIIFVDIDRKNFNLAVNPVKSFNLAVKNYTKQFQRKVTRLMSYGLRHRERISFLSAYISTISIRTTIRVYKAE
jgi:hypothetical protein